jgi:hypothetical protein
MGTTINKRLASYLSKSNYSDKTFSGEFNDIISSEITGYEGSTKQQLKSFFNDLQNGGCISGMIGEFIYNSDCKEFYIKHIDDLEEMKEEMEEGIGEPIANRHNLPHYTFLCWLCFEEYCYDLYRTIFED